jgi:hypothetical protein
VNSATLKNRDAERGSRIHGAVRGAWVDSRQTVVGFRTYRWITLGGSGFSFASSADLAPDSSGSENRGESCMRFGLPHRDPRASAPCTGSAVVISNCWAEEGRSHAPKLISALPNCFARRSVSARVIAVGPVLAERRRSKRGLQSSGPMPAEKVPWRVSLRCG